MGLIFLLVGLAADAMIGVAADRAGASLAPGGRAATALAVIAGITFATLLLGEALCDTAGLASGEQQPRPEDVSPPPKQSLWRA